MSKSSYAPFYDLFKLIVAIILLLIFLFLSRISPEGTPEPIPSVLTSTPLPPTGTTMPSTSTTVPAALSPTATSTPIPPTNTPQPVNTPTQTPAPLPPAESPTPIVEVPFEPEGCAVSPPQLQVGMKATIQRRLNFRSSPGIMDNWMLTNIPGTQVDVVGGPVCTRYQNGVAYLWWQIKLPNGLVGWSAEASAFGRLYFMEPVK